jgi:hypothetical protein
MMRRSIMSLTSQLGRPLMPAPKFEILRWTDHHNALHTLAVEMAETAAIAGQQEIGLTMNRSKQDRPIL